MPGRLKRTKDAADRESDERPVAVSTIAEETKQAVHAAGRAAPPQRRRGSSTTVEPTPIVRFVADDHGSRVTALVFQGILFCVMCLSLLAVIQQAQRRAGEADTVVGTGVNDAPPAVFVHTD